MKILQVNKFLYRRAGAEAYVLDLVELLKRHGQEVMLWGTDQTAPTPPHPPSGRGGKIVSPPLGGGVRGGEGLLVRHLNFDQREGLLQDLRKVGHMIWSYEAARKFERVLQEFKPEVVHIHNIYHHISPSILPVAARYKVPVFMTVHDWHLINPNYNLFDHGGICERNGWRAVAHRCIKNSYAASLADVIEWRIHKWMRVYAKYVAKFLVPNEFVRRKLVEKGMEGKKIEVVPLTVRSARLQPRLSDPKGSHYILFSGRLTVEKGICVLLEIAKQMPEIRFVVAGEGAEMSVVSSQVSGVRNVELLGFVEKPQLQKLIAGARLVLVPSLWEELSPLSVLEAMAAGKVVVASRIGGIPELIEDGKNGFLIPTKYESLTNIRIERSDSYISTNSYFVGVWVDKLKKLYYDEALLKKVGKAAKEYVEKVHSPEKHYAKIMEIYRKISNSPNF